MRQISVAIIVCASERRLIIEKAGVYSRIIYEAEPAAAAAVDDGADDAVSSISGDDVIGKLSASAARRSTSGKT